MEFRAPGPACSFTWLINLDTRFYFYFYVEQVRKGTGTSVSMQCLAGGRGRGGTELKTTAYQRFREGVIEGRLPRGGLVQEVLARGSHPKHQRKGRAENRQEYLRAYRRQSEGQHLVLSMAQTQHPNQYQPTFLLKNCRDDDEMEFLVVILRVVDHVLVLNFLSYFGDIL